MRCRVFIKTITLVLITSIFTTGALAQDHNEYPILKKYRKWGIIAGPILYNRATLEPQYGDYSFKNKPIWGFNAGIEYDFFPSQKWSVITGFLIALEPAYKLEYTIKQEDIYPHFTEDWNDKIYKYTITTFSVPLLVRLNIQINQNMFANFVTGFKMMYFPPGSASVSVNFHNEDDSEYRTVFLLQLESPDNSFQGSYVIGTGISIALDKILIKPNIIYVMNFQNTMEGYYMFDNMFSSAPAGGDYELSGNYIGLMFSVSLAKKKHKDY